MGSIRRNYTREDLKQQFIAEAEQASVEQVCMISFIPMDGNAALIKLLEDTFAGREAVSSPPKAADAVAATTFVPFSEIPSDHKIVVMPTNVDIFSPARGGRTETIQSWPSLMG